MKILYSTSTLLLLVAGVLGADKNAGESCTVGDTCVTPGSYCDALGSKKCQCNTGFVLTGSTCARVHGQACDASMCAHEDMICKDGKCACDTSANFAAGSANDRTCECAADYTRRASDNKCVKELQKACAADTDCVDNAECNAAKQCACKTGYTANGNTGCSCGAIGYIEEGGVCKKAADEDCNAATDTCVDHSSCTGTGGTSGGETCVCDASSNFVTSGSTCRCGVGYTEEGGVCKKAADTDCNAATDTCVDHSSCTGTGGTSSGPTCVCDASGNFEASSGACRCDSSKAVTLDGKCYLKNDQDCKDVGECYPATGKVCVVVSSGGSANKVCTCDTNGHWTSTGTTTGCVCDQGYTKQDNVCKKKAGEQCTGADICVGRTTPSLPLGTASESHRFCPLFHKLVLIAAR